MSRLLLLLFFGVISLTLVAGCGGDDEASDTAGGKSGEQPADAGTPEETFAAFQKALKSEDWKTASGHLTEESQSKLAYGVMFAGSFMAAFDESKVDKLKQLLEKHGISDEAMEADASASNSEGAALFDSIVKDKPAFVHDMIAFMEEGSTESEGGFAGVATAVLGKVEIDGDRAHGKITVDGKEEDIDFVRVAGAWKLELPEEDFAMSDAAGGTEFGPGGFEMGDGEFSFGDDFDFSFDESDAMPPVGAVALADLEDAWKASIDVTDQPARTVIEGLAGECGLELYEPDTHAEKLAQNITLSLTDVSRLEIIERACEQVGLYPRYKLRQMAFAEGPRPRPVGFAGPFVITLTGLQEHVPYTAGSLQVQLFSAALPIELLAHIQSLTPDTEEADDSLTLTVNSFTGSNGEELETDLQGGYETLVSTTTCLAEMVSNIRGLTSNVENIARVGGEVTFPVPVEVQPLSFKELKAEAEQSAGSVKVTLTDVMLADSPDGDSTISFSFSGTSMDHLGIAAVDKDGNVLQQMGAGGFSTGDGGQYDIYYEGVPASLEVRAITKTERVRYPFEITDIPLPRHAEMPDKAFELAIDGDSPLTIEFTGFRGSGDDREIGLKLTNHTNLPMSTVTLNLSYLDESGEEIDSSPHSQSGGLEMIPPGETIDIEVSAFFMPEDCKSVVATPNQIMFADLSEWYSEE